jgi:hypothetical protein
MTFSIQSTTLPSSASAMAMWVMAVVAVAPCQCFSPDSNQTMASGTDLFDRAVLSFRPAAAGRDDRRLPQRMPMPGRTSARLERDDRTADASRFVSVERGINTHTAGEILDRPFEGRVRAEPVDLHCSLLRISGRSLVALEPEI